MCCWPCRAWMRRGPTWMWQALRACHSSRPRPAPPRAAAWARGAWRTRARFSPACRPAGSLICGAASPTWKRPPPCACRPARPTATPWPWPWPLPRPRPMWACARCNRSCKWPRPRPARANRPCAWLTIRRASATPRSCSSPRPRPSCNPCSRPWSSWSCRWRASARRFCCWPVARVTSRQPRSWQQPTASPLRWAHRRLRRPPACLLPCCSAAPTLHGRSCNWRPPTKAWPCSAPPSCPRSR